MKRGFSNKPDPSGDHEKKKKRKSRWGDDIHNKTYIPGMPTVIPKGMNKEQEAQYLVQLQIEELSSRIRIGNLGIPENPDQRESTHIHRSPSPEPIYSSDGKRMNTREYRKRKELEDERHALVLKALSSNPEYRPPVDYKAPTIKVSDKVIIPQEKHPDINFVGLLIGPRGNTLKTLERETLAKIIIRGKGSVKEGKIGRKDGMPMPGEDEPLHAYITATDPSHVAHAVEKINAIIQEGINVPEGENDLRRQQLRELALLNGTLRETDCLGKLKHYQESQSIITNTIICSICGGAGHLAQDCKEKRPGESIMSLVNMPVTANKEKLDHEYLSLMAELGEGPVPPAAPAVNKSYTRPSLNQLPPAPGTTPFALEAPPPPFSKPPNLMSMNLQQQATRFNQPPPVMMQRMTTPVDNYRPPAVWQNSLPRNTVPTKSPSNGPNNWSNDYQCQQWNPQQDWSAKPVTSSYQPPPPPTSLSSSRPQGARAPPPPPPSQAFQRWPTSQPRLANPRVSSAGLSFAMPQYMMAPPPPPPPPC